MSAIVRPQITLEDRYAARSGEVLISGIQALVRVMLDLRRFDAERGRNTGVFVSGYPGSPLGGLDRELQRAGKRLKDAGVVFKAGVNEELAATAVGGTQLLGELAGRQKDGITGFWFGKNPGFDRAADAIRHANVSGTAPLGGAVALVGDDPSSKSSTVPSSCEAMCRSLVIPLLAPGSVGEVLSLGLHAVALSRHAGVWSALKIVADVADASATVELPALEEQLPELPLRAENRPPVLLPPSNLDAEHDLLTARLQRVHEYVRAARLNRITFEPAEARIAVLASGVGYQAVLRALADAGVDEARLDELGVRLVQLSVPWPIEPALLRELVAGVETVFVVEDKLPFIESQVKEALYRQTDQPLVVGKLDHHGDPLLSVRSSLSADDVASALARLLPDFAARQVDESLEAPAAAAAGAPRRVATFCSGCPHNLSTRAGDEQLVGVGIGCHVLVSLEQPGRRGQLIGMPQMGGEGAQWFGLAPFTSEPHFVQNLGDGTFHHSGSLAIRAAVAAGVNITYRLLYNDAVAMTGGQEPAGHLPVPALIRELAIEGVKRVIITTPEPESYRGVQLDPIASVRHRDDLEAVQRELAAVAGVTVLVHDDRCATEKRRLRKRGQLPAPAQRAWINERVCEGCGDCGQKSSCVSVVPVQTPFGRKTQIHQSSCNQDMSCLEGDCPSFLVVTPDPKWRRTTPAPPSQLPDPVSRTGEEVLIRMPGVGGTGVVTVSAILQMAAHLQGRHAAAQEQIGLAQKGGPVVSDLRISSRPVSGQLRATRNSVDVLIGFDLLGSSSPETLQTLDRQRTVAVVNTGVMPTASMVIDPRMPPVDTQRLLDAVGRASSADALLSIDAESISEQLFADHMPANMLLVGVAYQHGCIPLSAEAIERAIELNGAAVKTNLAAFRWGRAAVALPDALEAELAPPAVDAKPASIPQVDEILDAVAVPDPVRQELGRFVTELVSYQDAAYARRYARAVARVAALERRGSADRRAPVAVAYARGLFKLMAYKDEYEVARLHLDSIEQARLRQEFGPGAGVQVLLHPPLLRALGMKRKLRLRRSAEPLFSVLYRARKLRGTRLDPFGYAGMRRLERELIDEYVGLVEHAAGKLTADNAQLVTRIAQLPEMVRGYEEIKLANVEQMRSRAAELQAQLERPSQPADALLPLVRA